MNFSDELPTGQVLAQGGVTAAAIAFFHDAILNMVPYLLVAGVLIIIDLYFGVKAALHRGDSVRLSRAIRRTVSKCVEYLCWCTLASTLTVAFSLPVIEWVILGLVMGNEVISIITNYFEIHDRVVTGLNIFHIVGEKAGFDLSDVEVTKAPPKPQKPQERPRNAKGQYTRKQHHGNHQ